MIAAWWTLASVEVSTSTPGWDVFAQYSVLGVLAFILGWAHLRNVAREQARADAERERNATLEALIRDQITPVVRDNVAALTRMTEVVERLREDQRRAHG